MNVERTSNIAMMVALVVLALGILSIPAIGIVICPDPERFGGECAKQCRAAGLRVVRFQPGYECVCGEGGSR